MKRMVGTKYLTKTKRRRYDNQRTEQYFLEELDSLCMRQGLVVASATPSKILAWTQISEPTVDLMIGRSLVTYWEAHYFKLPS